MHYVAGYPLPTLMDSWIFDAASRYTIVSVSHTEWRRSVVK